MLHIHQIEKSARYNRVSGTDDEWMTGTWSMSKETAESIIGGNVHLHTRQDAPCYLGGKILDCKPVGDDRFTIHFRFDEKLVNRTTHNRKKNWSVEMLLEPV